MKLKYLVPVLFVIGCKMEVPNDMTKLEQFINVDISGDYKFYFDHLSSEYKSLIYNKYGTTNDKVVFDSLYQYYGDLHQEIKQGRFDMTNSIIAETHTNLSGISIIKYRSRLFDHRNNSELFKEKIVLRIQDSTTKFIPYSPKYTSDIDSLILSKFGETFRNQITNSQQFKSFSSDDPLLITIGANFHTYFKAFKSSDQKLFSYLYKPVLQHILSSDEKAPFSPELRAEVLKKMKQDFKNLTLEAHGFLVDDITRLECKDENAKFMLSYVIDLGNNIYIPGQSVVFTENNEIFFLEYDEVIYKKHLSQYYNREFLDCLSKSSQEIKTKLGLN